MARDLIERLLKTDMKARLGFEAIEQIREHPYFVYSDQRCDSDDREGK